MNLSPNDLVISLLLSAVSNTAIAVETFEYFPALLLEVDIPQASPPAMLAPQTPWRRPVHFEVESRPQSHSQTQKRALPLGKDNSLGAHSARKPNLVGSIFLG